MPPLPFQIDGLDIGTQEEILRAFGIQTLDETVTALASLTTVNNGLYHIDAVVIGEAVDHADHASYEFVATVATQNDTAALLGDITIVHTQETEPAWDASLTVDGFDIQIIVTGEAARTINWSGRIRVFKT